MKLKIEYLPLHEIKAYPNNAKVHTVKQIEQIKRSIQDFGMNDPIAIWKDNEVIEGHGRLIALTELGYTEAPVIRLDSLTDEQRKAYMLIHNKLTMNTGFTFDTLREELDSIDNYDMDLFGFNMTSMEQAEWFDRQEKDFDAHEEGNDEYNEFVDRYKPKKTTDDCYTPQKVYDALCGWVEKEYGVERKDFVRPFYPGGDYTKENYPATCTVVDNPPFSILSEIVRWYCEHGVRFFLFGPSLTLFGRNTEVCYIACNANITYENGAVISTGFITNMDSYLIRTAPDLYKLITEANKAAEDELGKQVNLKYEYPPYVLTAAMVGNLGKYDVDLRIDKKDAVRISQLDAQAEFDKGLFGGGFLLSEQAKAQAEQAKAQAEQAKAQAEQAKALQQANVGVQIEIDEKTGAIVWKLSEREMEIVRSLG